MTLPGHEDRRFATVVEGVPYQLVVKVIPYDREYCVKFYSLKLIIGTRVELLPGFKFTGKLVKN